MTDQTTASASAPLPMTITVAWPIGREPQELYDSIPIHFADAAVQSVHIEQVCQQCGCTDSHSCAEWCTWAAPGLCSSCEKKLPTKGGAVEGTTDQGTSGGEAAADDGRAGADSREVGAVVPEVLPASEEGGAGQPSAGAPPQLIGLDPRDEDVPEYVNDVGDRVMVLYDHTADRIELGLQDTHMDRPTVFMTWYGVADSGVPEEHKVRLEPEQANAAGQRLLDLAAAASPCCHLHRVRCCDPEDCGPCCEHCPTCPSVRRMKTARP